MLTLKHAYTLIKDLYEKDTYEAWTELRTWYTTHFEEAMDIAYKKVYTDVSVESVIDYTTWEDLSDILFGYFWGDETPTKDDIEKLVNAFEDFEQRKKVPLESRKILPAEKKAIVKTFKKDTLLNKLPEKELPIYKKIVSDLFEEGDVNAIETIGYGHYGGNRAFKCDFNISERAMKILLDKIQDYRMQGFYANTLGYIYYYGRVNGGVPQYEEAFKYFTFAANCGVYEAKYKLSDMYRDGLGMEIKSPSLAKSIVTDLYNENLKYIINGEFDSKFADIALRMGNYLLPDDDETDKYRIRAMLTCALKHYNEARFAIRMRILKSEHYGDGRVAASIEEAIEKTKEKLEYKPLKKLIAYDVEDLISQNLIDGRKMHLSVRALKNGIYKLTFKMERKYNYGHRPRIFMSVPEIDMCGLYDKITVYAKPSEPFECTSLVFDSVDVNHFYYRGELVGSIPLYCEFTIKAENKAKDKEYRFAAVSVARSDKEYDYLCDDENISIDDRVLVNAYEIDTPALVVRIFTKKENELALPLSHYKKIIGKI